jgi:hypothetical protein
MQLGWNVLPGIYFPELLSALQAPMATKQVEQSKWFIQMGIKLCALDKLELIFDDYNIDPLVELNDAWYGLALAGEGLDQPIMFRVHRAFYMDPEVRAILKRRGCVRMNVYGPEKLVSDLLDYITSSIPRSPKNTPAPTVAVGYTQECLSRS